MRDRVTLLDAPVSPHGDQIIASRQCAANRTAAFLVTELGLLVGLSQEQAVGVRHRAGIEDTSRL